MNYKDTNKRGQKQVYLHFAEREYLRRSQSTNKRGQKQVYLHFAERKYLRQSQSTNKPRENASELAFFPRQSIFGKAKDNESPRFSPLPFRFINRFFRRSPQLRQAGSVHRETRAGRDIPEYFPFDPNKAR